MDSASVNEVLIEGTAAKKIKVNGSPVVEPDVSFAEVDSSTGAAPEMNGFYNEGPSKKNVQLGLQIPLEGNDGGLPSVDNFADTEPSTSTGSRGEPLRAMLDFVEPQYVDEKTCRQLESIEKEIKEHVPLISTKEELEVLEDEYSDPVYVQKIMDLKSKYRCLRRTRGDGNCFYRSLGFSIFENQMKSGDLQKAEALKRFMDECKEALVDLKYPKLTMEDFNEQLDRVSEKPCEEELLDIFQHQGSSDFVVVWLRFLTVLQLQRDPDFYGNFIENHSSVADFCRCEVEPMFRESDHIHIIAVASLLNMKIRVEYMDRGESATVKSHDFPENDAEPEIFLLYRPGHYDVLYKS